MAKRKSSHKSHSDHLNSSMIYIAILSVVAVLVFFLTQTQRSLESKNQLEQQMREREELMSRGINPDPINIRRINLDQRWNSGSFSYHARGAYLMSDIADFGDRRTDLKIGTENKFLAVEVDVAYIREMGEKQEIMVNRNLRLTSAGRGYQPVSADTLILGPNQNTTSFVIFAVPMSASEFTLTAGGRSLPLDFSSETVTTMEGVFTTSEGYKIEFN